MNCPVCHNTEINSEIRLCPQCGTDIDSFRILDDLNNSFKRQRRTIKYLSFFLIFFFILSISSILIYFKIAQFSLPPFTTFKKNELSKVKEGISLKSNTLAKAETPIIPQTKKELLEPKKEVPPKVEPAKEEKPVIQKQKMNLTDKGYKIHIVKEGETAFGISRTYWGNGLKFTKLVRDNNLKDATVIYAGMELRIYEE